MINYINFKMFLFSNFSVESSWNREEKTKTETQTTTLDTTWLSEVDKKKVEELQNEINNLNLWKQFVWKQEKSLRTALLKDWDPKDKEFQEIAEKIKKLQETLINYWDNIKNLTSQLNQITWEIKNEISKTTQEEKDLLKNMSNQEFLSLTPERRLNYVTKWNNQVENVISWKDKNIEFTFTYNWVFNKNLFKLTTAWQVLPEQIRDVTSNWIKYERIWLDWEFFNKETNKRLIIKEWTQIEIWKIWNQEEITKIKTENNKKYEDFIKENPDYSKEKFTNAINEAIDKNIDIKLFINVLSSRIEEFDSLKELNLAEVEWIATEISKISWYTNTDIESIWKVLKKVSPTTYNDILEKLWYKKEEITDFNTKNIDNEKYNFSLDNEYIPWEFSDILSNSAEKSESWTTLCSRTARKNLQKLWIDTPVTWSSARNAWENSWSPKNHFPPEWDTKAKVADIFLDARSDKNKMYWHRVAAFKADNWNWYVLDPYYRLFWENWNQNTREPIPAELYVKRVWDKQKIWWAKYYW